MNVQHTQGQSETRMTKKQRIQRPNFPKVQDTSGSFNVSVWKAHWYNFRLHIATKFKKIYIPLSNSGEVCKEKIHNYLGGYHNILLFRLHICMRLDFLHRLQPRQHITPDYIQKYVWECSVLNQTIKRFAKM